MKKLIILAMLLLALPASAKVPVPQFNTQMVNYYCGSLVLKGTDANGCYVNDPPQIFIREGMDKKETRFVILHETGHYLLRNWTLADYQKVWGKGLTLKTYKELSADAYANYKLGKLPKSAGKKVWNMVRKLK